MEHVYKIKKHMKLPMVIATIISIPVFYDVIIRGFEPSMMAIAVILIVMFYLLTINNLLRKVSATENELVIRGIAGIRHIPWKNILKVDGVTMGTRQFISISTEKKHYLIPNSFDNFANLLTDIEQHVGEDKTDKGFKDIKANIINRQRDIAAAWITVIILGIIIVARVFHYLPQ